MNLFDVSVNNLVQLPGDMRSCIDGYLRLVVPRHGHLLLLLDKLSDLDRCYDRFGERLGVFLLYEGFDIRSVRLLCGRVVLFVFMQNDLISGVYHEGSNVSHSDRFRPCYLAMINLLTGTDSSHSLELHDAILRIQVHHFGVLIVVVALQRSLSLSGVAVLTLSRGRGLGNLRLGDIVVRV